MSLLRKLPWKEHRTSSDYLRLEQKKNEETNNLVEHFDCPSEDDDDDNESDGNNVTSSIKIPVLTLKTTQPSKQLRRLDLKADSIDNSSSSSSSSVSSELDEDELVNYMNGVLIPNLVEESVAGYSTPTETDKLNLCSKHRRFKSVISNYMILKRNVQAIRDKKKKSCENQMKETRNACCDDNHHSDSLNKGTGFFNFVLYKAGCIEMY